MKKLFFGCLACNRVFTAAQNKAAMEISDEAKLISDSLNREKSNG